MLPLKYLSNFWRTCNMQLINCEINIVLTWSDRCFIIDNPIENQEPTFTKCIKLLEQLKPGFKRTINQNKYKPKVTELQQNQYLEFLIGSSILGVNRLFVLSIQNSGTRTSYKRYYIPLVEVKDYNIMMDEQNFFDKPV